MNDLEIARRDERPPVPYRHQRRQLVLLSLIYLGALALLWHGTRHVLYDPFYYHHYYRFGYWYDPDDSNRYTTLGGALLLAEMMLVAVTDWRGFTTLRGRLNWRHLTPAVGLIGLLGIFLLLGLFPFVAFGPLFAFGFPLLAFGPLSGFPVVLIAVSLGLYLLLSIVDHRDARRLAPLERERHIAELEAQLGIPPATKGTCRECGKPLQLGAHYCAYCRAPAVPQPRICPSCAATAMPDASWCPKCGKSLDGTTPTQV